MQTTRLVICNTDTPTYFFIIVENPL
jgi:hypothetical protein